MDYKAVIRDVPDFPQKGIMFKDLSTLWKDPIAFRSSITEFVNRYRSKGIQKVLGVESRGFILGAPLAFQLGAGFVPIRKKGRLPADTISKSYSLEYGEAAIEIHRDALTQGEKILIVDDLLATGGTSAAAISLVEEMGGDIVECAYWVELEFLKGRSKIHPPVFSLIKY